MLHDIYIAKKVCKKDRDQVKSFCDGKPEGYLEKYVEFEEDFKYTSKTIAEIANVPQFYCWYKMCNNFVHNNLTSINVDLGVGKETIVQASSKTVDYMYDKIIDIIK